MSHDQISETPPEKMMELSKSERQGLRGHGGPLGSMDPKCKLFVSHAIPAIHLHTRWLVNPSQKQKMFYVGSQIMGSQ
jgi:hypothetical protein